MGARVLGPQQGDVLGAVDAVRDRFMLEKADAGGRFALVEHLMAPKALAAPVHRHTLEVISPAGLEQLFREIGALGDAMDPERLDGLAAHYGCEVDFDRTFPIVERYGLAF